MAHDESPRPDEDHFIIPDLPVAVSRLEPSEIGTMAPLIFNAWYVIALSKDVDRTLRGVKALGERLVYYRTEEGQPVVLDDRCAHRRYSLSKGRLKGNSIECGYHGFTYESSGRCVWVPGMPALTDGQKKLHFGIRSYPCAERGPWLWVWMGDPTLCDPADIPLPDLGTQDHQHLHGYKHNHSNYMFIIENLLDLSHIHFLHEAQARDYAALAPEDAPAPPNGVGWKKVVERTETGLLASFCGEDPTRLVRLEDETVQIGPSLCYGRQFRSALPGDETPAKLGQFTVVHALTPIDERKTHQFFWQSLSDPLLTLTPEQMNHVTEHVVFEQDAQALLDMQANVDEDVRPGRVEVSMVWDIFGVKMRRILKVMKEKELSHS